MDREAVKRLAATDQAWALLLESYPHGLWTLYQRLLREGFNPEQALDLTKHTIAMATAAGARR